MEDVEKEFEDLHQQKQAIEAKITEKRHAIMECSKEKVKQLFVLVLEKGKTENMKIRKVPGGKAFNEYEFTFRVKSLPTTGGVAELMGLTASLVGRIPNDVFNASGMMDLDTQMDFIKLGEPIGELKES